MKTTINIQRVITLVNAIGGFKKPDYLKVKDDKLYLATWRTDYHNGDIDNYKETLMKDADAAKHISHLERIYVEQQWEKYVEQMKANFISQLYTGKMWA